MFNGSASIFWRVLRSLKLDGQDFGEAVTNFQLWCFRTWAIFWTEDCPFRYLFFFFFCPPGIYWKYSVCVLSVWQSKMHVAWVPVNLTMKPRSPGCSFPSNWRSLRSLTFEDRMLNGGWDFSTCLIFTFSLFHKMHKAVPFGQRSKFGCLLCSRLLLS